MNSLFKPYITASLASVQAVQLRSYLSEKVNKCID